MIVLDPSAAVEWLLGTPVGDKVERRIVSEEVHAPHFLDLEIAQGLRKLVQKHFVTEGRAVGALDDLNDAVCIRHPHYSFLSRIWELRNNLSAYDAAYVVLAESLDATLVTCDSKLAGAPGHRAHIELIV